MIKTENFVVKFYHNKGDKDKLPVGTTVMILNKEGHLVAGSTAKLYHKDTFDKKVGRYYAFRKAMNSPFLEGSKKKNYRKELWEAFLTTCNQPKRK